MGVILACVFDFCLKSAFQLCEFHVLEILPLIGSVDTDEKVSVRDFVDQDIVDEPTVVIKQARVVSLPNLQFGCVIRRNVIDKFLGFRATHFNLAHVADVEQPYSSTDRVMLLENSCVLHRHVPPTKLDELSVELAMGVAQGRSP